MWSIIWQILTHIWELSVEAAPWVLVGLVVAGLIKAWIPERRMAGWLGGRGLWSATKAACIGAPLPLCSCGVIPAALGLRRSGASRSSTTAFLIATPETGADSVGASYALLGPFFAVLRPVSAVISGIVTGALSELAPERPRKAAVAREARAGGGCCGGAESAVPSESSGGCCGGSEPTERLESDNDGCCGGKAATVQRAQPAAAVPYCGVGEAAKPESACGGDDCCGPTIGAEEARSEDRRSIWSRTGDGLHYAVTEVLDDFSLWLVIGLAAAGVAMTFIPPAALASYGDGPVAMLVMLAIGVPFYVCATESTPIATAMLVAGVSPGAVLVFLLAGPATNLGTVGALSREFGWRYVAVYLAGIAACALGFGLLTDALVGWLGVDIMGQLHASRALIPDWLGTLSLLLLVVLALPPLRRPFLRRLNGHGTVVPAR